MQNIKASEFKAKCLALIDQVARTGEPLLVTKNGKPIAELRLHRPASGPVLGIIKNRLKIKGDIISPLAARWACVKMPSAAGGTHGH